MHENRTAFIGPAAGAAEVHTSANRSRCVRGWMPLLVAAIVIPGISVAGTSRPDIPSVACEIALAKSALPVRLRDRAAVYVWNGSSYDDPKADEGDFHCLVARNHPESVIPICVTTTGADSVFQGIKYKSTLSMHDATPDQQDKKFKEKVSKGDFVAPNSPGITYMMSAHTTIYQQERRDFWHVPAHVMMFAPFVDRDAIGTASFEDAMANPGVPIAVDTGPHAYIVTFVDQASNSEDVVEHCGSEWAVPDGRE